MKATNLQEGSATSRVQPALVKTEPQAEFIEDSEGRRLQLRELTILEENDVIIAAGPHGDNPRTLGRALLAARVAAITNNGDDLPTPIPVPTKPEQYRRMMIQVGHAGINAVAAHIAPPEDETVPDEFEHAKN